MLELKGIKKSYIIGQAREEILKGIDLSFKPGEFVALLGPSGSGKSTILNIIGGIDYKDGGQLLINGTDTKQYKERDWDKYRKNHIGFIYQNFNLIPHLTALENVEIAMTLSGLNKKERLEKAKKLLERVGLNNRMNHKPNELSGGQKQRVSIARALANDPDIILADEPTGALDSNTAESIVKLLREISDSGKLVIVVTHSKELSEETDRVVEMKDGIIVSDKQNNKLKNQEVEIKDKPFYRLPLKTAMKLASKNLMKKKVRTLLISVGASIGIGGVALMLGIGQGAQQKLDDELSAVNAKEISVISDIKFENPFKESDLNKIEDIDGVKAVADNNLFYSNTSYGENSVEVPLVISMEPGSGDYPLEEGRYAKSNNEVTISKGAAESLVGKNKEIKTLLNQKVNVRVQLIGNDGSLGQFKTVDKEVTVVGILEDGIFGTTQGVITEELSSELAKASAGDDYKRTDILVLAEKIDDVEKVKEELEKNDWIATSNDDILDQINGYVIAIQVILALFAGVSLVVSSIMIGIVLYISVLERTREIGVLKAMGARRKDIRRIFLTEAASVGFLGGVIGILIAIGFGSIINTAAEFFLKDNAFQIFISPVWLIVGSIVFSIVISIVAGLIPSNKAGKLKAIDALRYE